MEERDALTAEVIEESFRKTLWQQLYEDAVEACDEYDKAADTLRKERDALAAAAKLAHAYVEWHANLWRADDEPIPTAAEAIAALKKAGV